MLKKKKSIKEREKLSHKGIVCKECGSSLEGKEPVWRKGFGQTFYFCSLDCYVVWEMRT